MRLRIVIVDTADDLLTQRLKFKRVRSPLLIAKKFVEQRALVVKTEGEQEQPQKYRGGPDDFYGGRSNQPQPFTGT
jgi:hypothetical protein